MSLFRKKTSPPQAPAPTTSPRRTSLLEPYGCWLYGGLGAGLARILSDPPEHLASLFLGLIPPVAGSFILLTLVWAMPSLHPDSAPEWIYEGPLPMAWLWIVQLISGASTAFDLGVRSGVDRLDLIWLEPPVWLGALFLQMALTVLWTLRRQRRRLAGA